jgi:hypothetical protein
MNCFDKFVQAIHDEMDKEFTKLFRDIDMEKARQPSTKILPDKSIWGRFMPTDMPEDNKNYCKAWYLRLKKDPKKYASRLAKQAENQRRRRAAQRSGHEKG